MPIEIRELHIKVSVTNPQNGETSGGGGADRGGTIQSNSGGINQEELVTACVEKVMEIIQNRAER